jgi:hypothetical protein
MSWTVSGHQESDRGEQLDDLSLALARADVDRLAFAATGDMEAKDVWPASFGTTIAIANQPLVTPTLVTNDLERAKYALVGDGIKVPVPKYLKASGSEKTSGSSAATALAAGLASLILACVRFAYYEEPEGVGDIGNEETDPRRPNRAAEVHFNKFRHQHNMTQVLNQMCRENTKLLQPWIFFKEIEDKTFEDVKRILRRKFDAALDMNRVG